MRKLLGLIVLTLSGVIVAKATPPQAALSWVAPTTNTDGTPISGTITYNIYQGPSGSLVKVQSNVTGLGATITTGLVGGTTECFAVTSVVSGQESAQSIPACAAIPLSVPGAPNTVTVVVTGN